MANGQMAGNQRMEGKYRQVVRPPWLPPCWVSEGWLQSQVHLSNKDHGSYQVARPGLHSSSLSLRFCDCSLPPFCLTAPAPHCYSSRGAAPSLVDFSSSAPYLCKWSLCYTVLNYLVSCCHLFPAGKLTGTVMKIALYTMPHSTWTPRGC